MIVIDNNYVIGGTTYRRTVSDANLMIRKTGTEETYSEAVDVLTAGWTYEETDEPIAVEPLDDGAALAEIVEALNDDTTGA